MHPLLSYRQFTPHENEDLYNVARNRGHVERSIEKLKNFKILSSIAHYLYPYINKILLVLAYVVNNIDPIFKHIEKDDVKNSDKNADKNKIVTPSDAFATDDQTGENEVNYDFELLDAGNENNGATTSLFDIKIQPKISVKKTQKKNVSKKIIPNKPIPSGSTEELNVEVFLEPNQGNESIEPEIPESQITQKPERKRKKPVHDQNITPTVSTRPTRDRKKSKKLMESEESQ